MKNLFLIFLISLLLSSCAPAAVVPTSTKTTTAASTETPTMAPTRPPSLTSTPIPTTTSTPSLPTTIEFTFDKSIPEAEQNQIKVIVDEAYWFYVNLGCSSDGFKSRFYNGDGGQADYTNGTWLEGGIAGFQSQTSEVSTMISHEMVHAMCQIAFTKRSAMGAIDLRWLTEGVANYFSTMEQIENTGMNSGVKFNAVSEQSRGMAEWVSENFCQIQISKLEPANAHEIYPDGFGAIADVATRLLVKTTPDGINAVTNYYTLLSTTPKSDAFYQAFGKTKEEFYQQYQDECDQGFPTLIEHPEGTVGIKGNLIFTDGNQAFTNYMITFCKFQTSECGPSAVIHEDGAFVVYLELGTYYQASLNPITEGEPIGWYNSKGLVKDSSCGGLIQVKEGWQITIMVDLKNIIPCNR